MMDDPVATPPTFTDGDQKPAPERHSVRQKAQIGRFKKTIVWIGAIIILLAIGFEAYRVLTKKSKPAPVKQVAAQTTAQVLEAVPKDVPDAGTTKAYVGSTLGL